MLITCFAATDHLLGERFRLRVARTGRNPFTGDAVTVTGPVWSPLDDLAFFQLDGLDLEALAVLFGVAELEELDRTRTSDVSALPALYRVPPSAVSAFLRSVEDGERSMKSFEDRVAARRISAGFELGGSDRFRALFASRHREATSLSAEAELFAAVTTVLDGAGPDVMLVALAEDS